MTDMQTAPQNTLPTTTEVVIIGAGFGGLCAGIRLKEAGIRDFVILEKASEVGGTWRENTYPGCACDVQSHLYSYSFAGNPEWSKRYASWREIQDYILQTTDDFNMRPFIHFNQEVNRCQFDSDSGMWTIGTASGAEIRARYFILASGPLHHPQIPAIPGLDTFEGKVMHSAQWDHSYDLKGKRVASIGTGGSAIQYVPEIAPDVSQLDVYQRTAAWVIPRDERRYGEFSKWLFRTFPAMRKLHRARLYATNEMRVWPIFHPRLAKALQGLAKLSIRMQVKDPEMRKKLTPDYTIGCKRILISNKYYPAFNRDNVDLITNGIQEIRANSIVDRNGVERPCDTIILGTGFIVDPRGYMKDFTLDGLPGHQIMQDWKDGAQSYYGTMTSGFPNMFQLVGPNTALGHNSIIYMIESQVNLIISCMQEMKKRGAKYFDVKIDEQNKLNAEIQGRMKNTVWTSGCQSWYQQADGTNFTIWPSSTIEFRSRTRKIHAPHFDWVLPQPAIEAEKTSATDNTTGIGESASKPAGKMKAVKETAEDTVS